jgi:hypothetical protein
MTVFAPMMPDRLAREYGLGELSLALPEQRAALLLAADWNAAFRADIFVQVAFPDPETVALASMYRWQPELRVLPLRRFMQQTGEAIAFAKATRRPI